MTDFFVFALYLCFGATVLVVVPVMMVPGLAIKRKVLICIATFLIFVPAALALYLWLGAPQMANL